MDFIMKCFAAIGATLRKDRLLLRSFEFFRARLPSALAF
jgi:hypothetical protein